MMTFAIFAILSLIGFFYFSNSWTNYIYARKILKMIKESDIGKAKNLKLSPLRVLWTTVYIQKSQPTEAHRGIIQDALSVIDIALVEANTSGLIKVKDDLYGEAEAQEPNKDTPDLYWVYVVKFIPIINNLRNHLFYSIIISVFLTIAWYYFDIYDIMYNILIEVYNKM